MRWKYRKYWLLSLLPVFCPTALPSDQAQWGQAWSRNLVSPEKGLPSDFDPASGRNIRWTARLGTESHSSPIVAGGRVYIGTNNNEPRDPKHKGDRGVLMCFDEKDGALLWQLVVPKRIEDPYYDWPNTGLSSTATVQDDRVYILSNRGEVLCLDALGLSNGNQGSVQDEGRRFSGTNSIPLETGPLDADILWSCDLVKEVGIWSHDAANASILVHGDFLYVNTGTGVDNTHRRIRAPEAPSLVVINKATGRLVARDEEPISPNIFHCTWSSPCLARIDGKDRIIFAAGNGIVFGFEPIQKEPNEGVAKLRKVWSYDFDPDAPKTEVHRYTSNRNEGPSNIYGMPVFQDGRLYIAGGGDLWWGKNAAWLKCIDPRGTGLASTNAVLWSYPLNRHTLSTAAVDQGLAFVTDCGRTVHCVDAKTGEPLWSHETKGEFWASPFVVDGKVFVGTRRGDFWVFAAQRQKKVLAEIDLGAPISATVTAANGTLFVSTAFNLYSIASPTR